jgi:hypothetical protein
MFLGPGHTEVSLIEECQLSHDTLRSLFAVLKSLQNQPLSSIGQQFKTAIGMENSKHYVVCHATVPFNTAAKTYAGTLSVLCPLRRVADSDPPQTDFRPEFAIPTQERSSLLRAQNLADDTPVIALVVIASVVHTLLLYAAISSLLLLGNSR